jgi:hypothetical protein
MEIVWSAVYEYVFKCNNVLPGDTKRLSRITEKGRPWLQLPDLSN